MKMRTHSTLLLVAGFVAGVTASAAVAVYASAGHATSSAAGTGHYTVSIDEVRQNLVSGDFFNDHYTRTVTLSDGSVHRVALLATSKNGQPFLQLSDASGGKMQRSAMGPFGTMTIGKLMVSVKDAGVLNAQMHRIAGR